MPLTKKEIKIYERTWRKGNKPKPVLRQHRFFSDPDLTFHFDANPDPDVDPQQWHR